jgi:signal transduction histidine kinase
MKIRSIFKSVEATVPQVLKDGQIGSIQPAGRFGILCWVRKFDFLHFTQSYASGRSLNLIETLNSSIILILSSIQNYLLYLMDQQLRRMEHLIQIGRELSAAADLSSVSQAILKAALELTNSEGGSILETDSQSKDLRFLAVRPESQTLKTVTVPMGASIAGMAFRQKKTISVNDTNASGHHFKNADRVSGYKTRSLLACPILFRGESLGVIEVVNKVGEADYNGDDVTILETLAAHAALGVQNAHLQTLLDKTKEDAVRLDKMKSDFVAITSHELRTPLGLILGHSTFLRELVDEEYHPQMDIIIKSAMRLKEIIESMSSVDNVQSGMAVVRRRTVSVRRLMLDIVALLRSEAEQKKIILGIDIDDSDLMIEGDSEKISVAISNLVKNAITFTNEEGHVFIVAEQVPGYVKVAVIDDGIGIPARDTPHIFERFFQVESHLTRKHGGMGLGLSVAKMMVEMHGGKIWVESAEGKGSIFTVLFPLDSSQAEAAGKVFTT